MSRSEVEAILGSVFPKSTLGLLFDDYEALMKQYFLRNYDLVLVSGGRIVESLFVCLSALTENPVEMSPNFTKIQKDLEEMAESELSSSVRVIIPRFAKSVYDLRSKRNAVHVNPTVSPGYIDATLAVSTIQWILAELVRVFSENEPGEVSALVQGMVDRKIPIIEEITGTPIILESDISAHDSILVILYSRYPESIGKESLIEYLSEFTRPNIMTSLRNAEIAKLVFRKGDDNYLTKKGVLYVEDKFGKRYFGGSGNE